MDEESDCLVTALGPNPRALLIAVADVFTDLATQARTVLRGGVGSGPPLPNLAKSLICKKQTMESFVDLLSKLPRPSSFSSYPVVSSSVDIVPPVVFDTLNEFKCYWTAARRGQTALNPIMVEIMQRSGVVGSTDEAVIDNFYYEILGGSEVRKTSEIFQGSMRAIDAAFQPLFDQVMMSDTDSVAYLKAVHLRLQFLGVSIFNDPPQFLNVKSLQARTPLFQEYLSLAQVALRANRREMVNPAHQLSLQCGLAWYLLLISFFSRDPLVRGEAVWMLGDYPNQDGLWDTCSLHALALRNGIVERENSMEGTPGAQWRRLWRREFRDGTDGVIWTRQPLTGSGDLLIADLYTSMAGME
ncbi:uncharacterized protein DNG_05282 [Cephalotrichum gorgonifer]|uniref:Uncharacterized protein n=1 Tax=Cephalotrichum gorgonifer TaxID=2041049 RepID=A0AAE8SVM4_9PEZI|nr:uncharacterized protein DNG_05282 [Cephalotrichum gorgonifer]